MKVIAKYKFPLNEDKLPMKKYIKIEKIALPKQNNPFKSTLLNEQHSNISSDIIKQTIHEYDNYLEKIGASPTKANKRSMSNHTVTKFHKRNLSFVTCRKRGDTVKGA